MIVKFGDDATEATLGGVLDNLAGWTVEIEYEEGVNGFPSPCSIDHAAVSGLAVCEVNETGAPITNSLYHVGYDEIKSITIL